jgi:hypothetical protein
MATTDKYEFDTTNYGTTGWNALLATALEKADDVIHTYLRYPIASGESISAYDPVHLTGGQWELAKADGTKQPAYGVAIESGSSGEYLRAQQIGPLTNPAWSFSGSGYVYLETDGSYTEVEPALNIDVIGYSITPTTILIVPPLPQVDVGSYVPTSYLITSVGDPGSDTKVPTEQGVREALTALPGSTPSGEIITAAKTHNPSILADHGYTCSTANLPVVSGENASFGTFLCFSGENLMKSHAGNANKVPILFMALANASGEQYVAMPPGFIRDESWSWTPGGVLYASLGSGELTQTRPATSGNQVQWVGKAITAKKIYFNPSPVIVEVV